MSKQAFKRMEELMQEMVDTQFVSGVNALVLKNGKEQVYMEAGVKDLESKQPVQRDTIFRLYSMSKPITAFAAMQLLEQGRLELMDPVSKFIPSFENQCIGKEFQPVSRPCMIKDLLNMTSGLTYGAEMSLTEQETENLFQEMIMKMESDTPITTLEFANRLGEIPLAFQPGSSWQYGASADILGAVIEVVSGMQFGEYLRRNLFEPLGMVDTGFYVPEEKQHRVAKVYEKTEEGLRLYTDNHLAISNSMNKKPAFESGGAGLVSTIDDYARFATMLLQQGVYEGKQYLHKNTVEFFTTGELRSQQQTAMDQWQGLEGYTYGNLMRVRKQNGPAMYLGVKGEYGWDGWLGAYFTNDPVNNMTFLMMIQRKDAGTNEYTRKLRNVLYGLSENLTI